MIRKLFTAISLSVAGALIFLSGCGGDAPVQPKIKGEVPDLKVVPVPGGSVPGGGGEAPVSNPGGGGPPPIKPAPRPTTMPD